MEILLLLQKINFVLSNLKKKFIKYVFRICNLKQKFWKHKTKLNLYKGAPSNYGVHNAMTHLD